MFHCAKRHLIERRVRLESGVINQDVHRPKLVANGLEHFATSVFIRNVGAKRERGVAVAAQLIDHRLRFVFASDIIDAHRRAGMSESERDGSANSRAGAGHDRLLALEQFAIFCFRNNRLRQIHKIILRMTALSVWDDWLLQVASLAWCFLFCFADSSRRSAIPYKQTGRELLERRDERAFG